MNVGGALAMTLCAYGCWSLGSFDWALPIFLGLTGYLTVRHFARDRTRAKVKTVVKCLIIPFVLVATANVAWINGSTHWYHWLFGPYLASCIAVLQQVAWIQMYERGNQSLPRNGLIWSVVATACWVVIAGPMWLLHRELPLTAPLSLGVVSLVFAGVQYGSLTLPARGDNFKQGWLLRHALSLAAAAAIGIAQAASVIPLWAPS
jgi:hypothetical protein